MKKFFNKAIVSLYIILAFLTPLIFCSFTSELYEFPKMIFVYILGTTTIALFLIYRVLLGGKIFSKPNYLILGYIVFTIISVIFSSHRFTSVWGYYSRFNGGLVSFLVFFSLYQIAKDFLDDKSKESIKNVFCLSLLPVSLYGIFQITEHTRIFSTLGQPNWLAAYLVFLLPLLLQRIINSDNLLSRFFWIFIFLLSFICLWFTKSLSGILGMFASAIWLIIHLRRKILNKWFLVGIALLVVLVGFNFNYLKARVGDALVFSTDPAAYNVSDPGLIRAGLWQGSLKMATSSPRTFLVGNGPETFAYEFPFFRENYLNYSSEWDFILNKPHNYYLELWVESGIFTLLFYLAIVVYTLKQKDLYLSAGFLAFYVTNIFSWPTVATSLIFWFWLSFVKKNSSP